MRPLRQMIRDARRGVASHGDIIEGTVEMLGRQVREHPDQFRFLVRERYGGVAAGAPRDRHRTDDCSPANWPSTWPG